MSGVNRVLLPGLLLALILTLTLTPPSVAAVAKGDKAPDFSLGSVDGESTVKLSDSITEPTLLVFWVSWCPHCQREVPILQKIFSDLGSRGMNCVGVSVDSEQADAKGFVKDNKLTFPNAFAGNNDGSTVLTAYGVNGVPAIFIIGSDDLVKATFAGETDEKAIRDEIGKLGVK